MTISCSKSKKSYGFSLFEVLLAVGLCAILAAISVPTMVGWLSEHRLRVQVNELVDLVQSAKLQAERTGQAQVVALLPAGEKPPLDAPPNVHFLTEEPGTTWSLRRFGQIGQNQTPPIIEIDRNGWVSPVSFRVSSGNKYVEYSIDFLSGHAQEVAFSL